MNNNNDINRRTFLQMAGKTTAFAAAGLSILPATGFCAASGDDDDKYDFLMPRVRFRCDDRVPDQWNVHPVGDQNLLKELSSVIRCKVKLQPAGRGAGSVENFNAVVDFEDFDSVSKYPFLFMTAEGYYTFNKTQKENLKKYIHRGGFLFMDDCKYDATQADYFYQSSYKLLPELFGDNFRQIPFDHEVFHNIYDFGDKGLPHLDGVYHPAQGVFVENRLAIFLSSVDIHCCWVFSSAQRYKRGIQIGINIIMYSISH